MLTLIDVSEAQGRRRDGTGIDWVAVAADRQGIAGAIIKATEGIGYVDGAAFENSSGALANGLLIGWYHYAHFATAPATDPVDEAVHFVETAKKLGFVLGKHILALDIEEARRVAKGPAFVRAVLDFCDAVEAQTGQICAIYTGGPFFDDESGEIDAETQARLARHILWLAAYVSNPNRYVPKAWRASGRVLHQISGDVAPEGRTVLHVAGIGHGKVAVDCDLYDGTIDQLHAVISSMVEDIPPTDPGPLPLGYADRAEQDARDTSDAAPVDDAAPTQPQTPSSKSSQRLAAVRAPIVDGSGKPRDGQ